MTHSSLSPLFDPGMECINTSLAASLFLLLFFSSIVLYPKSVLSHCISVLSRRNSVLSPKVHYLFLLYHSLLDIKHYHQRLSLQAVLPLPSTHAISHSQTNQLAKMQLPYIPEFADHMETGSYATTFDLHAHLYVLNNATITHINTLERGDEPYYHPNHPDYFPLFAILFKANADSYDLAVKMSHELARYEANMRLLYQEYTVKYLALVYKYGDHEEAKEKMGTDLLESGLALEEMVHGVATQKPRKGYLTEIFRFWRRYASTREWGPYEEVWRFVAGRALPRME